MTDTLRTIAENLEASTGFSSSANLTEEGYWRRIALALEGAAGVSTVANANEEGYAFRAALALEVLEGTSGAEETRTLPGYLKRIADALESKTGVAVGNIGERIRVASQGWTPVPPTEVPANLELPVISGTPTVGETLTASRGVWSNSANSFAYQWYDDGVAISEATGATLPLMASEETGNITVGVIASNVIGSGVQALSAAVGPVAAEATPTPTPTPTPSTLAAPTLTKTSAAGANPMSWSGSYTDLQVGDVLRLAWERNNVAGAGDSRTITSDDILAASDGNFSFAWTAFQSAADSFADGDTIEVWEFIDRGGTLSPISNVLTDTVVLVTQAIPASLYGATDVGYAFDPTDTATMFQQIDGTVAVADTNPIGYLADVSGEGKHFTAAGNDTTRPTYTAASGGLLAFDGANDILQLPEALLFNAGAATFIYAVKGATQADKTFWNEGANAFNQIYQPGTGVNSAGGGLDRIWIRNDAGASVIDSNSALSVFDNTLVLITITDDGSSITVSENRVAGSTRSYTRGTHTFNRTGLGGRLRSSAGNWFAGNIGRFIAIGRVLTAQEKADAEAWVAAGHGITLP